MPLYVGVGVDCLCNPEETADSRYMISGAANIAGGTPLVKMACTGQITGGTSVFYAPDGLTQMFAVEQLGRGFLFVCGDGSVLAPGCDAHDDNCAWFLRLSGYDSADII